MFLKDLFSHSKVVKGDTRTDTDTQTGGDLISLFVCFQNKESGLERKEIYQILITKSILSSGNAFLYPTYPKTAVKLV
jgi:hypothetical protein